MSATILFQSADAAFSAFLLATITKAENMAELAAEAAKRQLEVASAKGPLDSIPHLVNAALCHVALGQKGAALSALQRAHVVAPTHVKAHLKKALDSIAPPPAPPAKPAPAAPKAVDVKPAESPKPAAPAPAPAAPAPAPAAPAKTEAPKAAETVKPTEPEKKL